MKQIFYILILLFSVKNLNAQFSENNAIYLTNAITVGNYLGLDVHANYVLNEKYSFKLGYVGLISRPKHAPQDYSSGLFSVYDQMDNFQILAGKIYSLNKKGTIRTNISFGLGFTVIREHTNWQLIEGRFLDYYSYENNKYNTISFIINPKIEFPFTRFYGLALSPMLQINKDRTYIGIGIGHMAGLLRKRN